MAVAVVATALGGKVSERWRQRSDGRAAVVTVARSVRRVAQARCRARAATVGAGESDAVLGLADAKALPS